MQRHSTNNKAGGRDLSWIAMLMILGSAFAAARAGETQIDYSRDIQPIFAQHCLECHGIDTQEAGFRFDRRASSTAEADSGERPIVPGRPGDSEMLRRVVDQDPDTWMPPEGERLTSAQIHKLTTWIADGAKYTQHWAYRPLRKSPLPHVQDPGWCRSEIDYFVLDRLQRAGIEPSPTADRYTLIRRLYYDLLGLPPTIDAVDTFVRDRQPQAYQRLVDRGAMRRLFNDAQVAQAVTEPPSDTRAFFRGSCVRRYPEHLVAANWDSLVFDVGEETLKRVPMMEPLKGTSRHVADLLDAAPDAAAMVRALGGNDG